MNERPGLPPVLIPEDVLQARIAELGAQLTCEYRGCHPLMLGVLVGSFMFMADLVRRIDLPVRVDFVRASSYGSTRTSSGQVELLPGPWHDLAGRDVLIVEDVLDTGRTLGAVVNAARENAARSVHTVVLLRKPGACVNVDYVGFDIESRFVVGYGLDDGGSWRQLPYIGYVA